MKIKILVMGEFVEMGGVQVSPVWAATQRLGKPRSWTITHVPTGMGVGMAWLGSKRAAIAMAKEIAGLWPEYDMTKDAPALSAYLARCAHD
jgi:hypothetical protein